MGRKYQSWNPTRCSPPTTSCGEATWGNTTTNYDALNRVTSVVEQDGSTVKTSYTGRATEVTDEGNGTSRVQRISQVDGLGRMTSVCEVTSKSLVGITPTPAACGLDITATGFLTSYAYDPLGDLTGVTQGGLNPRAFQYDSLSRLTSALNPESGTTTYGYDANGNVIQRVAPTATTAYTYDALNRLLTKNYSDGTPGVAFYYDQSNPWGLAQYEHNYIGRLTQAQTESGGRVLTGAVFSYDPMGRIVDEWQCTPLNCGVTSTNLAYAYDRLGDLTTSYNNTDGITYTNSYNAAAELTSVQSSLDDSQHPGTLATFSNFNAFQKPQNVTLGNGIAESFAYTNRGWVEYLNTSPGIYFYNILEWVNGGSTIGYAPNGNILYGNDTSGYWKYTYDDLNRLTAASCSSSCPPTQGVTYTYDRFGNRHAETVTAGTGVQLAYVFTAKNQIDQPGPPAVTYDAAGNMTDDGVGFGNKYTYDAENRIITAANGSTASYVYDAFGHRVRAVVNGETRDFLYDLSGRTIDQLTAGTLARTEAYAGSMHVATYVNSTTEFDNSNWLSTVRIRSDVAGNKIDSCTSLPFGEDLTCTGTEDSPLHFTGKERDSESSLDYFGARYNASSMGRFMSPDRYSAMLIRQNMEAAGLPSEAAESFFNGYLENPQSWNQYSYVRNNPLTLVDPTGAAPVDGHHLIISRNVLTGVAGDFANSIKTGQLSGSGAPNQPGFNAMHREYNAAVEEVLEEAEQTMGDRNTWSISQWKDVANQVLNSQVPAIRNFLDELEANNPGARAALSAAIAGYRLSTLFLARTIAAALGSALLRLPLIIYIDVQSAFRRPDQEADRQSPHKRCLMTRIGQCVD